MGAYHEPRVPQGEPADGERDVWLEDGVLIFGHYVSATGLWQIDKEFTYDSSFAAADHTHGGTFSGDADTIDGLHASSLKLIGDWVTTGYTIYQGFSETYNANCHPIRFRKNNGYLQLEGFIGRESSPISAGTVVVNLPVGFRPSHDVALSGESGHLYMIGANGNIWVRNNSEGCSAIGLDDLYPCQIVL